MSNLNNITFSEARKWEDEIEKHPGFKKFNWTIVDYGWRIMAIVNNVPAKPQDPSWLRADYHDTMLDAYEQFPYHLNIFENWLREIGFELQKPHPDSHRYIFKVVKVR